MAGKTTKKTTKKAVKKRANPPIYEKAGAPTKYRESYCKALIEHMSTGMSFLSFAAEVDVTESTLFLWADTHKQFSESKAKAFTKNRAFWEKQGIDGLFSDSDDQKINSKIYIFNMKNRFPKEWRDTQEIKIDHSNLTPWSSIGDEGDDD